ncbi:DUF2391 family protein [Halobacterium litoreum]|uniref:DUF2391 family protein n=1 Tax=Halobacterium litoreum TaxID=2039234 RepID=A0ABD5NCC9_9EURY|nr:DUF2391 family protein [Halobacterium litoreum]UHH14265.1 DUF2391 family protein [Halobacterium litoreum]
MSAPPADDDPPDVSDLVDELEDLDDVVDDPDARRRLDELKHLAGDIQEGGAFGQVIYGFDRHDAAEAVLGALLFGIPMAVEGGTNEAGAFVASNPALLAGSLAATVAVVHGVLYVAEFQDVRVADPFFGFLPRRLVGVLAASGATAAVLLTAWGRVSWTDPWLAACTVAVALTPMAIGAALGDILPGS